MRGVVMNGVTAELMDRFLTQRRPVVELAGPAAFTGRHRMKGERRNFPLIGADRLVASGAYFAAGAREGKGEVVLILTPTTPAEFTSIEVPVNKVNEHFGPKILNEYATFLDSIDDEEVQKIHRRIAAEEAQRSALMLARKSALSGSANHPDFGSW
jgi:hypothetical protein